MPYDFELSLDTGTSVGVLLQYIERNSRVLEFGCAYGRMTRYMSEQLACSVSVVEYDRDAFASAMRYAKDGLCDDIMNFSWEKYYEGQVFDYIIFADVLEHLSQPQQVLNSTRKFLKNQGKVLLSVPNIGHNDIIANLLNDQFQYTQYGLLDQTHIHFFVESSLEEMCKSAGYAIVDKKYMLLGTGETEQGKLRKKELSLLMRNVLNYREKGNVYQYVLVLQTEEANGKLVCNNTDDICKMFPYVSVYVDCGDGFSEKTKKNKKIKKMNGEEYVVDVSIAIDEKVKSIRIDPVEGQPCIIQKIKVLFDGDEAKVSKVGIKEGFLKGNDPQIIIPINKPRKGQVRISFSFWLFGEEYIEIMNSLLEEREIEIEQIKQKVENLEKLTQNQDSLLQCLTKEIETCKIDNNQKASLLDNQVRHIKSLNTEVEFYVAENVKKALLIEDVQEKLLNSNNQNCSLQREIARLIEKNAELDEINNRITSSNIWKLISRFK